MKVTGYQLRAAIKRREVTLQVAIRTFEDSLFVFPGEQRDPVGAINEVLRIEKEIARLQTLQARYNLDVALPRVDGLTLAEAVKFVGGAGRIEKLWRSALPKKDRYALDVRVRRAEDEQAVLAIDYRELVDRVDSAAKYAANLRGAIAAANNTEIDLDGLTPEML